MYNIHMYIYTHKYVCVYIFSHTHTYIYTQTEGNIQPLKYAVLSFAIADRIRHLAK